VSFIAEDSVNRALIFFDNVIVKIKEIVNNPYMYRQREAFEDGKTRELIFKGYTIPFYIDDEKNKVIVLGIFNQNIWQ